jgi:hypothetical protein
MIGITLDKVVTRLDAILKTLSTQVDEEAISTKGAT